MNVFISILDLPDLCKILGLIISPLPQDIEKFLSKIKPTSLLFEEEISAAKIFILSLFAVNHAPGIGLNAFICLNISFPFLFQLIFASSVEIFFAYVVRASS